MKLLQRLLDRTQKVEPTEFVVRVPIKGQNLIGPPKVHHGRHLIEHPIEQNEDIGTVSIPNNQTVFMTDPHIEMVEDIVVRDVSSKSPRIINTIDEILSTAMEKNLDVRNALFIEYFVVCQYLNVKGNKDGRTTLREAQAYSYSRGHGLTLSESIENFEGICHVDMFLRKGLSLRDYFPKVEHLWDFYGNHSNQNPNSAERDAARIILKNIFMQDIERKAEEAEDLTKTKCRGIVLSNIETSGGVMYDALRSLVTVRTPQNPSEVDSHRKAFELLNRCMDTPYFSTLIMKINFAIGATYLF